MLRVMSRSYKTYIERSARFSVSRLRFLSG